MSDWFFSSVTRPVRTRTVCNRLAPLLLATSWSLRATELSKTHGSPASTEKPFQSTRARKDANRARSRVRNAAGSPLCPPQGNELSPHPSRPEGSGLTVRTRDVSAHAPCLQNVPPESDLRAFGLPSDALSRTTGSEHGRRLAQTGHEASAPKAGAVRGPKGSLSTYSSSGPNTHASISLIYEPRHARIEAEASPSVSMAYVSCAKWLNVWPSLTQIRVRKRECMCLLSYA